MYGGPGPDVWRVLEEGSYELVQNRIFEIEEEEKQVVFDDGSLSRHVGQTMNGSFDKERPGGFCFSEYEQ